MRAVLAITSTECKPAPYHLEVRGTTVRLQEFGPGDARRAGPRSVARSVPARPRPDGCGPTDQLDQRSRGFP